MKELIKETDSFTPASREEWRKWLKEHHHSKDEIWLIYYKKHTGIPTLSYNDSVEEALCFGWIDGIKKSIDGERYTHRFTPRRDNSKWSELNFKRAKEMIAKNLMQESGLKHYNKALTKPGRLIEKASKKIPSEMPADLVEALKRKGDAFSFFFSLSPSYRKMCISWISSAKRDKTRSNRISELTELSAQGKKIGMK